MLTVGRLPRLRFKKQPWTRESLAPLGALPRTVIAAGD